MVDAGYKVEFERYKCHVSHQGNRSELGYRHGSLYYLTPNKQSGSQIQNHLSSLQANYGPTTNQSPRATIETWHRQLCYRSLDAVSVKYLSDKVTDLKISDAREGSISICGVCAIGRQHKEMGTGTREKATEILKIIYRDLCGPMQTPTHTGERYLITFIDGASGSVSISLLKTKDGALAAFQGYQARAEKARRMEIHSLRTVDGGVYMSKEFKKYLTDSGIQHIVSPAYTPTQNGRAERINRTIMESTRYRLEDLKLGREFWG